MVPEPSVLVIVSEPPTAETRSASPASPEPTRGAAPPTPSSSNPAITHDAATQVYDAIAADHLHLPVLQLPGHLLLTAGIVTQAIALFRARVVPRWVPILTLAILLTYAFPGSGVLGLVSVVPMTAGCIAVAYFTRRRLLAPSGTTFRA